MDIKAIGISANAVRSLCMDAVQKANSGHPGLPMGCAELGAVLYGETLKHFPGDPEWIDRDRFILSAGHGSMLLYSLLHLCGYDLTLEDIKNFRQFGSKTPGHPEYGMTPGVETTTGPLGQGIANAVGMAVAETILAARFNTKKHAVINHFTYALAGDGDLMEGLSSEACSLAGHLGLGKLIVFYDSNKITIEGSTDLAFTEDVLKRFEAYKWQTLSVDAYDPEGIIRCVEEAKKNKDCPSLIMVTSVIAKGSPNLAGSHKAHGAPLGEQEVRETRRAIGIPEDADFHIPEQAASYFEGKKLEWEEKYRNWCDLFSAWSDENPELFIEWKKFFDSTNLSQVQYPEFKTGEKLATRKVSGMTLNAVAEAIDNLIGGSADLSPSNATDLKGMGDYQKHNRLGRNFHFGVREHGMGSVVNGIALHGGFRVFCATFLVFSDYMRPSIRLAAMMKLPVIYIFTHDSIYVGEDGPTHQPVEHVVSLRTIPGLLVLRPGDAEETVMSWKMALENRSGPTALILTRQSLEVYVKPTDWKEKIENGAYIVKDSQGEPETVLIATGSEVNLALKTAGILSSGSVRVVSMISRELFLKAPDTYRKKLIPDTVKRFVIEAGVSLGWGEIVENKGFVQSIERFGESGPAEKVSEHFGLSAEKIAEKISSYNRIN